tara:strand:+ start:568 stop:795 length:228 start_codon:yes stop_codon:yes gene_type:complete
MVTKLSPQTFYVEIDKLVCQLNISYMDAVVHYCETNNLEIETAASIIRNNSKIKAIVQNEGEDLNLLPRTAKLPL